MTKNLVSFDYAIKYLLKNKGDYYIVEGFISALLATEGYGPVKIKALLDSESNKEDSLLKKSIADLVVEDEKGDKYIIEIERQYTSSFLHKACFNTSRLIVDSIEAGDDYKTIKKVFHISLLYFSYENMTGPLYYGKTIMKEMDAGHPIDLHIEDESCRFYDIANIFPEYILISVPLFNDVIKREIDEWLYVMKHSEVREDFKSPYMKKVEERLSILKMNAKERDEYYRYRKESLTQRDAISAAEEKGEARGREEGKIEGKMQEKKKIALKMLQQKLEVEVISQVTGLSIDEILTFKKP